MAQSTCGIVCLLSEGRGTQLGPQRHLPRHDAIHGYTINWAHSIVLFPAVSVVVTSDNGGLSKLDGRPY